MPNKKDQEAHEDKDQMQPDQPSVEDDGREAITHPEETYSQPADTSYRAGDPPPSQSLFPPPREEDRIDPSLRERKDDQEK